MADLNLSAIFSAKERLLANPHTRQSPTVNRKREATESNENLAGCQPIRPALSPPEASRSTSNPLIRYPIITVFCILFLKSWFSFLLHGSAV